VDLQLTPKEYELFKVLALNEGHIFSYENLIKQIDDGENQLTQNAISAHIKNIRKKLSKFEANSESIRTIWGVGYRFDWNAKAPI
jgi:two-component system response regulator BaeR